MVEFLKTKDQAAEKFKNYVAYLEHQYSMSPKWFCMDNGSEYIMGEYNGRSARMVCIKGDQT